jgi:UTP:GlnB (protein PII) uridylyltransferase
MPPPSPLTPYLGERDRIRTEGWYDGAEGELTRLLTDGIVELAGAVPDGSVVVATGGFGRAVMALNSDVDLLFLHSGSGEEELARRILRPLWDAHLKVGHLSHTPKDARRFAGTRLDAISTFLSARPMVGDLEVFREFQKRFVTLLEKEHGRIIGMMSMEERRRRDEEPYRLMACDLKNGRGGIRTLDLLDWRRKLLAAHGAAGSEPEPVEWQRRMELTAVRSALHAVTGRLHDRFDFELREPAARWLNMDVPALGRFLMSVRTSAESMVDRTWPEVAKERARTTGRMPDDTRRERRGDIVSWWRSGIIEDIPDLDHLLDEGHVVPFHSYAVADHTLAAVDQAWEILDGDLDDPIVQEVVADLQNPMLLIWAALLHDLGKGLPGDHCRTGADRIPEIGRVIGLDEVESELLERVIAHHLLLADVATKFDHTDGAVLSWAGDRLEDRRTLRLLYLLTVADSRATGSDTWSPWRAELLRRAYRQMEREMSRRSMPAEDRLELLVDRVISASAGQIDRSEAVAHLAGFSEGYAQNHSPDTIRDHILLSRRTLGPGEGLVEIRSGVPIRLTVSAKDRPKLLLDVAGILALHRLSIIDARFAIRTDGRVFDTFEVVDGFGNDVEEARLEEVQRQLERALRGSYDIERPLEVKRRAYRGVQTMGYEPVVTIHRIAGGSGTVELEAADRLGLLHDIAQVFHEFGMPIARARVDTRGGIAYDTFSVSRLPADDTPLAEALEAALR